MRFGSATVEGQHNKEKQGMRHRIPVARFPGILIMKTAGKLVVLGSINADHILNLDAFPTPGETVTGHHYQVAFGGKGANRAVAAGRSGANIAFIACTGDDDIGERVRRQLESDNIDVAPVRAVAGESTGVALIFVNAEGENTIGIHAGANAALSVAQVDAEKRAYCRRAGAAHAAGVAAGKRTGCGENRSPESNLSYPQSGAGT